MRVQWTDLDLEHNTVRIAPEKGSNSRLLPISSKLVAMLNNQRKNSTKVFDYKNAQSISRSYRRQRDRLENKLGNPRLKQITLYTFRHFKGTMEYARTKDICMPNKCLDIRVWTTP